MQESLHCIALPYAAPIDKEDDPDEKAEALAETFNVTKLEAMNVLTECNNDLRAAVKVLHAKSLESSD